MPAAIRCRNPERSRRTQRIHATKLKALRSSRILRAASDVEPVSRILYGVAAADGHSSRPVIAERLKRPTRKFGAPSRHAWKTACAILHSFPIWSCSVWGLPCARALLRERCALTAPFHPYPKGSAACACFALASGSKRSALTVRSLRRYILCGTFRKVALKPPSRTLSGTLLCGVRTFLSLDRAARETPASTSQTATIRFDISYPYYKMNSGSKGFDPPPAAP